MEELRGRGRGLAPRQEAQQQAVAQLPNAGHCALPQQLATTVGLLCCARWLAGRRQVSRRRFRATGRSAGVSLRATALKEEVGVDEKAAELLDQEAKAPVISSRAQRLKDMVYVKDLRAAITSGEFALRVTGAEQPGLIDFQGLLGRFENFARRLRLQPLDRSVLPEAEASVVLRQLEGMCVRFEERVQQMASGHTAEGESSDGGPIGTATAAAAGAAATVASVVDRADPRKLLYWREDQTVDFDGALNEANKAARFSADLWERLNGRGEDLEGFGEEKKPEIPETPMLVEKQERCEEAIQLLADAEKDLAQVLERAADPAMLGQASELRRELREAETFVRECKSRQLLTSIDLLLEKAAALLEMELERSGGADWDANGGQLKISVVEFSLLDQQATYYWQFLPSDPQACALLECPEVAGAVDPAELRVLEGDAMEFAGELGIEVEENDNATQPFSGAQRLFAQACKNLEKARAGFTFYTFGGQLLWQDVQYGASLFSKAAFSNYTLKPREVRALQRTAKDIVTLIPFLIILIIPLSPIGHVLVFSFIQKFFPDFFPSTFTERRQNVVKIYQDVVPGGAAQRA